MLQLLQALASRLGGAAALVLDGAQSRIAEPAGSLFHFDGGSVGLRTSGSGDILAGTVAGLAASLPVSLRFGAYGRMAPRTDC